MSVINLSLPTGESVCNGKHVSFAAPCACTGVTGVSIDSTTYSLVNADGNDYVSNGGSWVSGAYLTVMLDCTNSKAYVVNDHTTTVTIEEATTTTAGLMSAADKTKLNGLSNTSITAGTTDLTAGTSALTSGTIYLVYE